MEKTLIKCNHKHESGLDEVVYQNYMEREANPIPEHVGPIVKGIDVGVIRYPDTHFTYPLIDLAKDIQETDYQMGDFFFRHYVPKGMSKEGPCIVYIHGGGFTCGTVKGMNNVCRRLSELLDSVVIYVSYSLSPEVAYPTAVNQCYEVVKELVSNHEKYLVNPNQIVTMGDSAGGNLCLSIAQMDKENKYIKEQVLFYPAVDVSEYSRKKFNLEAYGNPTDKLILKKLLTMKDSVGNIETTYLQGNISSADPMVSPLLSSDFSIFPKTLMITAEYDYLRLQCEEFVEKLLSAGVDCEYVCYEGTLHGFLDRLGFYDSSDHCLHLVAYNVRDYFKSK